MNRSSINTDNHAIVARLREAAELLEMQQANPFRVAAYRRAADTLEGLERPVTEIVESSGQEGLVALPAIGEGIASAIVEMVATGQWRQLERLRGGTDPLRALQTVPGIGPELAERLHDQLQIDTLEELENAAHQGELRSVEGIGERRAAAIRAAVTAILDRRRRRSSARPGAGAPGRASPAAEPEVRTLLEIDRDYRERAAAGKLPTIAPRRFNPEQQAWLPIMHGSRDGWHFTALYSNTARAHELDRTRDWVVIYFYDGDHTERQRTVVTETRGSLQGRRVVRGREADCRAYYA